MRCHEIQERFIDLLYQERGTPPASPELEAHVRSCAACQKELAELKELRSAMSAWKDEPPLRPIRVPRKEAVARFRMPFWRLVRYAAVAALVTLAFLGLTNAQVTWGQNGFAFRTSLFAPSGATPSSEQMQALIERAVAENRQMTREEMKTLIERAMADYQGYNFQMMQRLLDTVDQERAMDYRSISRQIKESRSKY